MLNTSRIRILAVGKVRKTWILNGIKMYLKRLPGLEIYELRSSSPTSEGKAIKNAIKKDEVTIALSEEGETLTSHQFADHLQKLNSKRIVFIIGGSEGLCSEIRNSADLKVSLSVLTFPHEIARLLLIEQIYRAHTILQNTPYHRN